MTVRGTCPVCGADVALKKDGIVRQHRDHRACDGACRRGTTILPICPGSGAYLRVGLRRLEP